MGWFMFSAGPNTYKQTDIKKTLISKLQWSEHLHNVQLQAYTYMHKKPNSKINNPIIAASGQEFIITWLPYRVNSWC